MTSMDLRDGRTLRLPWPRHTGFVAGARLQLAIFRRGWDSLLALVTVPLFTIAFLAITRHAGRTDLTAYAVLAPAVVAVIGMAILTSGEVVTQDRSNGSLELALAAPSRFPIVVVGRVLVVTLVSLVAVVEAWLVAWIVFGVRVPVPHRTAFAGALAVATLATVGTALLMSSVFVAARSARTFQNTISYPLYLLGGAFVPVPLLPGFLQPLCRAVYLSWATDLLRDCLATKPVPDFWPRLGAVAGLGAVGFAAGYAILIRVVDRARATGRVGHE
jgi:ABC-2 type transport system permease protein